MPILPYLPFIDPRHKWSILSGPRIQTLPSPLLISSKKLADGKSWQNSRDELQNIKTSKYYIRTFLLTSLLISLLILLYMP